MVLITLATVALPMLAPAAPATRTASVDDSGVLRWDDDGSEVALFGVNYYTPFSLDYESIKTAGLDHDQAIRDDVTHFTRLGLTSIRLHCWDRQISDREGNLVDNEHLRLLDYLISQCKEQGIYSVMTPIAWWNAPRPGGFSDLYTMHQMTTDPKAWEAQCRYLGQYMNHVNRYTGLAYKDDPAIIAIELINEPLYPNGTPDAKVTEYINTLCKAVRDTGCTKPIFYNCWGWRFEACAASTLNGVSFNWYPTGLVSGGMLKQDYLPRVNDYPEMRDPRLARLAKMVYEFDAADVHGNVMYPVMARGFRSGGAQIANQFQYDPLCIAAGNPDWQTHYLNLVYTPGKAVSFAIAAEAFQRLPRLKTYGPYPGSTRFGDFRVSYADNLSELVTLDTFMYSNDTATQPPAPEQLTRIVGCGSSPLVQYGGTGAYFLDRLAPGVWKLQVYPDAVMVRDPYVGGPLEKMRCLWGTWEMTIRLPDLGADFQGLPTDGKSQQAREGALVVTPGEYLLLASGKERPAGPTPGPAFICPPSSVLPPAAFVDAAKDWREGYAFPVKATVAMSGEATCVLRYRPAGKTWREIPLPRTRAYQYETAIPADLISPGKAQLYLSVRQGERLLNFPGGDEGERPREALDPPPPAELLTIRPDDKPPAASYGGPEGKSARTKLVAGEGQNEGALALRLEADGFGPMPSCASTTWKVRDLPTDITRFNKVRILARGGPNTSRLEVSLVQSDGNAFGYDMPLAPVWQPVTLALDQLRPMWSTKTQKPDLKLLDHLTFVFGAWHLGDLAGLEHWAEVQSVALVQEPHVWEVDVVAKDSPVVLMAPAEGHTPIDGVPGQARPVPGLDAGKSALRVAVSGFPDGSCTSFRRPVPPGIAKWRQEMAGARFVLIKARAGALDTNKLELVLIEEDGTPWGVNVPLTQDWRAIRIPIEQFWFFKHWLPPDNGRGKEGDHLKPEHVQWVNICFGAWLYGETATRPHAVEVQEVSLVGE